VAAYRDGDMADCPRTGTDVPAVMDRAACLGTCSDMTVAGPGQLEPG